MVASFVDRGDDFHQMHFVDGVEEVQPGNALGVRCRLREPRDRQSRGVRRQDGRRAEPLSESAEDFSLHVFALDDCFDHEIGAGDWFPLTRRRDVPEEGIARVARQRLLTALRVRDSIFFIPPATISSLMSFTTTGMPFSATSCAIPPPSFRLRPRRPSGPARAYGRRDPCGWLARSRAGRRALDQVASGRREDDPGEPFARPRTRPGQRAAIRLRWAAALRAMRGTRRDK